MECLGIRVRSQQKYPGRMERNVGSIVNMHPGIRYSVRLFVQYENLPRSMNCEMQARNRSFSGICKQWEQLRSCRLKDFNTTAVGSCEGHRVCHIVFGLEWFILLVWRDFDVWCDWKSATWRSPDLGQTGKWKCYGIAVL